MKMRIDSLGLREISTKRGITQVYDLVLNGQAYDAFVESWNCHWQKGQEIDIEPGQIQRREKNGHTYLTVRPPAAGKNGANGTPPARPSSADVAPTGAQTFRIDQEQELEITCTWRIRVVRKGESAL